MITGRSEASTELCSGELAHVTGEIGRCVGVGVDAGAGVGRDSDVDVDVDVDGPATAGESGGGTVGTVGAVVGGTGEPLVAAGGVASPLGGRPGLARDDEMLGVCREPLGVGVEDGRAECLRAPRAGVGGASGGSGRRTGVRMRVLREVLDGDGDEGLDVVARGGVGVGEGEGEGVGEFERSDGP
jgi:hypothetical protein